MTCAKEPCDGIVVAFRGWLKLERHSSSDSESDPTFLAGLGARLDDDCPADADTPLAGQLAAALAKYGDTLRVRFVTGEDRKSAEPLDKFGTGWAEADGRMAAEGSLAQGPRPGQWVVRESITVGREDLLKALKAQAGRFVHLELVFRKKAADQNTADRSVSAGDGADGYADAE